ncbi:MAG TPA: hypothetical protein VF476_18965 [Chitinophagaceae bacterium]
MKYRLSLFTLLFPLLASSQTLDWWKNLVNWDGTSHWSTYLITSPKYFGPNAFSVPMINNGSVDSVVSLGITGNFHFSKGDNTQNLMLYGNYSTKKNTISFDAQFVPYERFQLSHAKKEERRVYYKDYYKKNTVGDVVVNTTIQLFERWRKKNVHMALRVGLRMPSGSELGAARYADVPAYWIDIGNSFVFKNSNWKWINMLGFLVWQTNDDDLRQDDAFLFGSGVEWNHKKIRLQAYGAGYLGYKSNGDKPVVFRMFLERAGKKFNTLVRFQQGLHDFEYTTAELGVKFIFPYK